jgi:hypothetical protein
MEKLKASINDILSKKSTIDWLIVHEISKLNPNVEDLEFSFVDGKERINEPFKTSQGYIYLKTHVSVTKFEKILVELCESIKANSFFFANLYIIITRIDQCENIFVKKFKENLGEEYCQQIFNLLIESLNLGYYEHSYLSKKKPTKIDDWLALFHSAQHLSYLPNNPIISCLQLIKEERNNKLDFELIQRMQPLIRSAVLMGWHGFELEVTNEKIESLYDQEKELIFLSALLLNYSFPDKNPPNWLSESFIEIAIEKYWDSIGKQLFVNVFGLSYRNRNQNKLYKKLEDLIHLILFKKLKLEQSENTKWINILEFADGFIALFSWFSTKEIKYEDIPSPNRALILNKFIQQLQKISDDFPIYLASENNDDPFSSFQLHEEKYRITLAHLLILLLDATESDRKRIENICFEIKPLFYGGYKACLFATRFAELLLLIGLSVNNLENLEENHFIFIQKYLEIIAHTILIPYIHLVEREEDIWNPEREKQMFEFNAGRYLILEALSNIYNSDKKKYYQNFFNIIDEVKVANWPYERTQ